MAIQQFGQLTLGACVPTAAFAYAELVASINLMLPELNAKIAGLLALQVSLGITPPSLSLNLQAAIDLVASLQVGLELDLPGIDFQLTAVADLLAELNVFLGALNAKLALALGALLTLGTPGIFAYQYTGATPGIGSEVDGIIAGAPPGEGPTGQCVAWVFVAADAGAIAAAQSVFVTP